MLVIIVTAAKAYFKKQVLVSGHKTRQAGQQGRQADQAGRQAGKAVRVA